MRLNLPQLFRLLPFVLALALLGYRAKTISQQSGELYRHDDFNHYYATAYLLHSGVSPYGVPFAKTPLNNEMLWPHLVPSATNPPSLALLTYPLALFSPVDAWLYWHVFLLACSLASLWLITHRIFKHWSMYARAACWTMFLASTAFYSNALLSHVQPLILLLVILGWVDWREERSTRAAVFWGAATAIKLYTWPLLLLPLMNGRKVSFIVGAATAALVFMLPGAVFGSDVLVGFWQFALPIIEHNAYALDQNMSLAQAAAQALPPGLFQAAGGSVIAASFMAGAAALCARPRGSSIPERDLQVVLIGTLCFFCAPVCWESYLISLILPFSAAWHYSNRSKFTASALFMLWLFIFYRPHPARMPSLPFADLYQELHYPLKMVGALLAVLISVRAASAPGFSERGHA